MFNMLLDIHMTNLPPPQDSWRKEDEEACGGGEDREIINLSPLLDTYTQ